MDISRRQFLILAAGTGVVAGCRTVEDGGASTTTGVEQIVNVGPAGHYATEGVYDQYRSLGFFVVRKREKLFALSAFCTHKKCKLNAEKDHSFYCKCHGSTFNPDGKVTTGPAKRDLPIFPTFVDENGQLQIKV